MEDELLENRGFKVEDIEPCFINDLTWNISEKKDLVPWIL